MHAGDLLVYITRKSSYDGVEGWALVAILVVAERFGSHEEAAGWYRRRDLSLPSNCMVPGNPPESIERTSRRVPKDVKLRIDVKAEPERALRLWDAMYAARAKECGVFLVCQADYLELRNPRVLRREDLVRIFGRVPGTQNPPRISTEHGVALERFALHAD